MTTQIPLRNRLRDIVAHAIVDDEDAETVLSLRWHRDSNGYPARYHQRMHELVASRMGILGIARNIDHANGDRLDNRRENLRPASQGENVRNPTNGLRSTNRTGVRGVWWDQARHRWVSQGTRDGSKVSLGRFDNLGDAIAARRQWERIDEQPLGTIQPGGHCPAGAAS